MTKAEQRRQRTAARRIARAKELESITSDDVFISFGDVELMTGMSRATIYRRIAAGEFPKQVQLSESEARNAAVGFPLGEVRAWVNATKQARTAA
ncbi:AlpA family phage regulatory protein [Pseudomonas citronellolis]|uniref:helix-turn-helix transcriptional regulator n=1 Tax=Pseudomonas citronellolis TaxID=53408 RepID=UPI00226E74CD|nr:AlpA family phage regulatory protein [Pseudomonas citronellolis]WAB92001.1 AlpA family phage regulatory protein [Pseudomonas citronellolis]